MNINELKDKKCFIFPYSPLCIVLKNYLVKKQIDILGFGDNFNDDVYKLNDIVTKEFDYVLIYSPNHHNVIFSQLIKVINNNKIILINKNNKNQYILNNKYKLMEDNLSKQLEQYNLKFKVEIPYFSNNQDASHTFSKYLLSNLCEYNKIINTNIIMHNNIAYLKKRDIKTDEFLFSYHSIGSKDNHIIRWKEGYLHNMITFDSTGYSGWSSLCNENIDNLLKNLSNKKATKYFGQLSKKYINNNQSKYNQPQENNFIFPKKFIFFPLQTIDDSVIEHSYFEPIKLINNIINILYEKNIPLVIKQHPRCNSIELKIMLQKYEKEKKLIIFNGSIHQAIAKADTIYTINSGVGFESLLHLKPVVTFGKSDYMNMTKNITSLDAIEKNPLYRLTTEIKSKIKSFVYYYATEKSIFIDDEKQIKKFIDTIIKNYLKGESNV